MELTDAIQEKVNDAVSVINKFLNNDQAMVRVEVGKTTNHHNKGDIFRAEFDINSNGEKYYASSQSSDLYQAISDTKDQILREINSRRGKKQTLFKRGAMSVKKRLKGILSYKR